MTGINMLGKYFRLQIFGICFLLLCSVQAFGQTQTEIDSETLGELEWRSIGPAQFGGRVADIEGVAGEPEIFYIAHSSAGLFKTTNGGVTFSSIFDDGNTLSIGAIALEPGNPEVIYVGTGEGDPRNSISFGDGIYQSTDGGETWNHLGLEDTEHFSEIVIHPDDPNIVYAAAMGHAWGANEQRGIFRSENGGTTWEKVLYTNNTSGASDVRIDPNNPNIIYAGMYDHLRKPWHFRGGGPGSGLYRSVDGGDTWKHLTDSDLDNGLPGDGLIGRVGVAVSQSNSEVVYTLLESEKEGELWRSDDGGKTWKMVNDSRSINTRPFYYTDIHVDPRDENRIYSLTSAMQISTDGGRTFDGVPYQKMFGDVHALWIDPERPNRFITGSDGGFYISNDYGENFEFLNTLPFAQAYHVGVDMAEPYNVYGGFQDHEIWMGPNEKWNNIGVKGGDWKRLRDWGDGMYTKPDPHNPKIVYYNTHLGDLTRMNLETGEERYIMPYPLWSTGLPASAHKYRFNWNSPIELSPNKQGTLYFGGNVAFKSEDEGHSWEVISPDLTTEDPEKMKVSGGSISTDNTRAEYHCTITSIDVSPFDEQVIWAGTDDGNIQITRNGGDSWSNVASNIPELPDNAWVSRIQASPHDAGTAYLSVDQHRLDDFAPHTYVTTDYGETWTDISDGLEGYVHLIIEDPEVPQLLYAGTELGVFASFDAGQNWTDLRLGLPNLPVRDLVVHPRDNDLVIATHARGFYILDDVTPLQELAEAKDQQAALFEPKRTVRYTERTDPSTLGDKIFLASNKPYGAIISYYLNEEQETEQVKISIKDSTGTTLHTFNEEAQTGINRVAWDLEEDLFAHPFDQQISEPNQPVSGPRVLPGEYTITLTTSEETLEQSFQVHLDPNVEVDRRELVDQYETLRELMLMSHRMRLIQRQADSLTEQLNNLQNHVNDDELKQQAEEIKDALDEITDHLSTPSRSELATSSDNIVDLQSRVGWLINEIESYSGRPTEPQIEWTNIFSNQLDEVQEKFDNIVQTDIAELNEHLQSEGVPHIISK